MKTTVLSYTVIIRKENKDFVAYVPTLGISDFGASVDAAKKNVQTAFLIFHRNKIHVVDHDSISSKFNNLIVLDGVQYSFFVLRNELGYKSEPPKTERLILVSYETGLVGLVVDEVFGENQAVLKSLGKLYKNQALISGATILGDGTVALVLDTNKMIKKFSKNSEIIN